MKDNKVHNLVKIVGADLRLMNLFEWWNEHGPFHLWIPPNGGVRFDEEQYRLWCKGRTTPGPHAGEPNHPVLGHTVTDAKTSAETAHGIGVRGKFRAIDAYPCIADKRTNKVIIILGTEKTEHDPRTEPMLKEYGRIAKEWGLGWGGDWRKRRDAFHVYVPDWKTC